MIKIWDTTISYNHALCDSVRGRDKNWNKKATQGKLSVRKTVCKCLFIKGAHAPINLTINVATLPIL